MEGTEWQRARDTDWGERSDRLSRGKRVERNAGPQRGELSGGKIRSACSLWLHSKNTHVHNVCVLAGTPKESHRTRADTRCVDLSDFVCVPVHAARYSDATELLQRQSD